MHVMTDPHDTSGEARPIDPQYVDQLVREPIPINGLNSAERWRRRVSRVRRCRSFGEICELCRFTNSLVGGAIARNDRSVRSASFSLPAWQRLTKTPVRRSQIERRLERIGRFIHQFAKKRNTVRASRTE
jgi:hypothetical protein